jgi:thymidine kinase
MGKKVIEGYKFKYFGDTTYAIAFDDEPLSAGFIIDDNGFVVNEIRKPIDLCDFFNSDAFSEIEKISDSQSYEVWDFWLKNYNQISNFSVKKKLFQH